MTLKLLQDFIYFITGEKRITVPPVRNKEVPNCDLKKDLMTGDIVLYRFSKKDKFLEKAIAYMTSSPYTHAEIYLNDFYTVSSEPVGITYVDIEESSFSKVRPVDIFRIKGGLTREQRLIIESKIYKTLLRPYDYVKLLTFAFRKKDIVRKAGNESYICSEYVAWCYKNAGLDLIKATPESIESPADLGKSDILEYVGTYLQGNKIPEDYSNEFLPGETEKIKKTVGKLLSKLTMKDEYYKGLYVNKAKLQGEIQK